ncbi:MULTISPECIES: hypothetical protein [Methanobacterium]|nr:MULTISPECIES: hypothetical protein [Methanobacterium]
MDKKKWLNERYTFYEEIFEFRESYCLEFCLKEDLKEFIDSCFNLNIPFTFYPQYKIAIQKVHLKKLIEILEKMKNNIIYNNPQLSSGQVSL